MNGVAKSGYKSVESQYIINSIVVRHCKSHLKVEGRPDSEGRELVGETLDFERL